MTAALAAKTEEKKRTAKAAPGFEPEPLQLQQFTGAPAGLPRFLQGAAGAVEQHSTSSPSIQFKCAKCQEEEGRNEVPIIQAKCSCCGGGACRHDHEASSGLRQSARDGVAGASHPLPHLDRIQASFGHHDVSGARTQIGGPAAHFNQGMGSLAYTAGDRIAFRDQPDIKLAAHEATHVVQQRSGAKLAGGVGRPGDEYEQQADAVAEAVGRGDSAEPILDRRISKDGRGPAPVVQQALQIGAVHQFEPPIVGRPPLAEGIRTSGNKTPEMPSPSKDQKSTTPAPESRAPVAQASPAGAAAGAVKADTGNWGFHPRCYDERYDDPSDDDEDQEPPEPKTTESKEEIHPDLPRPRESDNCPIGRVINAQAPPPATAPSSQGASGPAAASHARPPAAHEHRPSATGTTLPMGRTGGQLRSNMQAESRAPSPLENAIAQAESGRDVVVSSFQKSDAATRALSPRIAALSSGVHFLRAGSSAADVERTEAAEARLADFFRSASERLNRGLSLATGAVPDRLGSAAERVKANIGASIDQQKDMVSANLGAARSQAHASAASSRAQIHARHNAAVAGIEQQTRAATHTLTAAHEQTIAAINRIESSSLEGVNGLYSASYDAHVALGPQYAALAETRGEEYALAYEQKCKKYNADGTPWKDGFFAGYLTNRRADAQANAARETAKGYRKSLVETANDQAAQITKGRKNDRCGMIAAGRRTRQAVDEGLGTLLHALHEGHAESVAEAASTRNAMLAAIDSGLSNALSALDLLEHNGRQSLDDTGYLQQLAVEQGAHASAAAVQNAVAQATSQVEAALAGVRSTLAGSAAPEPQEVDQILAQTGIGFKGGIDLLLANVESGISAGSASLDTAGDAALAALDADAALSFERTGAQSAGFSSQMESLAGRAADAFGTLRRQYTEQTRQLSTDGSLGFAQAVIGFGQCCGTMLTGITSALGESQKGLEKEFQSQLRGLDSPFTGIPKQAAVAASKEQPAWKKVLTVILIIAIVIVVALVIGPAVIGAVGAAAAALGASAGVATAVGAIVGGAVVGALSSGAMTVVQNWGSGQRLTKGLGHAIAIGALTGAVGGAIGLGVSAGLNSVVGAGGRLALSEGAQFAVRAAVNVTSDALMNVGQQMALTGHVDWGEFAQGMAMSLVLHGSRRVQAFQGRVTATGARGVAKGFSAVGAEPGVAATRASAYAGEMEQHSVTAAKEAREPLSWTKPTAAPELPTTTKPTTEVAAEPSAAKPPEALSPVKPVVPAEPAAAAPVDLLAPSVVEGQPPSGAVHESEVVKAGTPDIGPEGTPEIGPTPSHTTEVGLGDHKMYARRGPNGIEVGMCSGVCGPLKARIAEMQAAIGDSEPGLHGQLEDLKTKATDLENRVDRGEVTNNQLNREMTDLASRVRIAAEDNPVLRQMLETDSIAGVGAAQVLTTPEQTTSVQVARQFAEQAQRGRRVQGEPEGTQKVRDRPNIPLREMRPASASEALAHNMLEPRPAPNYEAHHIVPRGDPRATELQGFLQSKGIGLNDGENGVWLPRGARSRNVGGEYRHEFTFRNEYFRALEAELLTPEMRTAPSEVVRVKLQQIGERLSESNFQGLEGTPSRAEYEE